MQVAKKARGASGSLSDSLSAMDLDEGTGLCSYSHLLYLVLNFRGMIEYPILCSMLFIERSSQKFSRRRALGGYMVLLAGGLTPEVMRPEGFPAAATLLRGGRPQQGAGHAGGRDVPGPALLSVPCEV